MRIFAAVILLHMLCAAVVPASASPGQKQDDACARSATEPELLGCRANRFKDSEAALAKLQARLRAAAVKDYPATLKAVDAANAHWQPYRDAECTVLTRDSAGGSAYRSYLLACQDQMNRRRIDWLQQLIDNP